MEKVSMQVAIRYGALKSEIALAGASESLIRFIVTSIMLAYLLWWLREWIPLYQF